MAQIRHRSPDPRVAPTPILSRHLDHEIAQLILGWRATYTPAKKAVSAMSSDAESRESSVAILFISD